MSDDSLTATVLIPARNEEVDIERCLGAVLAQDHPHDGMEIIVVDGGSTDRTAKIASLVLADGDVDWKIVDNPAGTTPSNLNAGLAVAAGEIVCRVDARSIVPPYYVRLCVEMLQGRDDVVVTGGAQVAVAQDASHRAAGIARALNNRLAMGGSPYRSRARSGPSDTVYLGAFRTEQLRDAGGWDVHLATNQDFDLNRRLSRLGTVWFDVRLQVGYVPRRSLGKIWSQYHRFGRWKVRYWRHTGDRPRPRQLIAITGAIGSSVVALHSFRSLRGMLRSAVIGVALLAAIDEAGSTGAPAPVAARLAAMAATATTTVAWASGVILEAMFGRRR